MPYDESLVGKVIGNYEVLRELGRGGMGVVYKAHEQSLQRVVALKVLPAHLAADRSFVERFEREARSSAGLSHPNVVTVYAVGEQQGMYFIAMEYVKGQTVAEILRRDGRLEVRRALEITAQVADALATAHKKSVIHRDIKPQNVMVDEAGRAKVMDFGLAKVLADSATNLTTEGALMGTPKYMSPEQCQGYPLDARTDIYSLGVMLYEMLAGQVPFSAETPLALLRKIVDTQVPSLSDVAQDIPPEVIAIVARMVAKDPAERYPDAGTVVGDIRAFLRGSETNLGHDATMPTGLQTGDATMVDSGAPIQQIDRTIAESHGPARRSGRLWKGAATAIMAMFLVCVSVYFVAAMRRSDEEPEDHRGATPAEQEEPQPAEVVAETIPAPQPVPEIFSAAPSGLTAPADSSPSHGAEPERGSSALDALAKRLEEHRVNPEPAGEPSSPEAAEPTPAPVEVARAEPTAPQPAPEPPKPKVPSGPKEYAGGRFIDQADGTVLDTETGAVWQKGDSGKQIGAPLPPRSTNFKAYAEGLSLGGRSSWRIPTKAELQALRLDEYEGQPLPFANSGSEYWCFSPGGGPEIYAYFNWAQGNITRVTANDMKKCYVRCITGP